MPVTVALDALPLYQLLKLIIDFVQETAAAAVDVCSEKRSFNELSAQLTSIHAILVKFHDQNLSEVPAVSFALRGLHKEVKKAADLIQKVKNYSLFRHIIYCRHTLKEFQSTANAISGAFDALRSSFPEVAVDLAEGIETVNQQLRRITITADKEHLAIAEDLERGRREWRMDNQVANNILNSILRSVGGSQESTQISQELASLRKDKEDAAEKKALQLDYFLDQVISILSSADAAYSLEESLLKYNKRKENYNYGPLEPPYKSFNCPISKVIMRDPVTASNQKTYERQAIEEWFENNGFTDPDTHDQLPDGNLRPNRALFDSISEWTQQRNVSRILHAKNKLQSGNEAHQNEACRDLLQLCEERSEYKDWIASEDLIPLMINMLHRIECRDTSLYCLRSLVQNNERNKLRVVEADGIHVVVKCLARSSSAAKAALMLLAEMVNNNLAREKMESAPSFFLWVVTRRLHNESDSDSELTRAADCLLDRLSDKDENIMEMLKWNWCDPLLNKFHQGASLELIAVLGPQQVRCFHFRSYHRNHTHALTLCYWVIFKSDFKT